MATTVTPARRAELIAEFKRLESQDDIIALVNNLPSMRLIVHWNKVSITLPHGDVTNANNVMRPVKQMWLGVELDMDEIATIARIPLAHINTHVTEAMYAPWIYPDGSVHGQALGLAKATIVRVARGGKES